MTSELLPRVLMETAVHLSESLLREDWGVGDKEATVSCLMCQLWGLTPNTRVASILMSPGGTEFWRMSTLKKKKEVPSLKLLDLKV